MPSKRPLESQDSIRHHLITESGDRAAKATGDHAQQNDIGETEIAVAQDPEEARAGPPRIAEAPEEEPQPEESSQPKAALEPHLQLDNQGLPLTHQFSAEQAKPPPQAQSEKIKKSPTGEDFVPDDREEPVRVYQVSNTLDARPITLLNTPLDLQISLPSNSQPSSQSRPSSNYEPSDNGNLEQDASEADAGVGYAIGYRIGYCAGYLFG